ncbi:MAG TPA: hypothetical protein VHM00_16875 [Caldimonas sp.]|jgi:hypothetical protein|nr:hypothetical protein [Caldimonas sp.]HEX2542746.1 hypothetical protein [Caldimonas sp.]
MKRRFFFRKGAGATLLAAIAAAVFLSVPALDAQGQTIPLAASERPLHLLKAEYLACDRASAQAALSAGTAAYCSMVGEELLQRGFEGDFERLIAWWRGARQAQLSGPR